MTKTILITGASSGIGRATAELFAAKGWNVAATMRSPEKAETWLKAANLVGIPLDVTDVESIQQAVIDALRRFGSIEVVVNNAGYGLVGPFEASTEQQVERQLNTNVLGLMNVIRELLPHFRERRQGTIINVASMGGRITFPLYSIYHASKWAVDGFSEALTYELRPFGIRVKIIEPGPIKTDFYDRSMDLTKKEGLDAYDSFVGAAMPNMQRSGQNAPGPEVVAKTIFRAATDGTNRLRYPVNSGGILLLRKLLPDQIFLWIVRRAVGVK
jgi:NAD(P)-dependent dehydrogenase (short-subunit alcohol dehydrogenase family)